MQRGQPDSARGVDNGYFWPGPRRTNRRVAVGRGRGAGHGAADADLSALSRPPREGSALASSPFPVRERELRTAQCDSLLSQRRVGRRAATEIGLAHAPVLAQGG